ncbi:MULTISPECIES: hypothetical protein [Coprobacillaceae]|uniref:hypothetical protein n=1 Tax=Coprobacillaceae TaxID=2810280 RepID=UPI000E4D12D7|nr:MULTISPECIES: hypothetical protein [Coprobacillaceae]RHM63687.1 hypothetical protein DWZ53_00930 [Coprobacillus sp. AF33-1AC]RHS96416.1 hypothetical protein DW911_00930 [Erysipelatoclostridium sp. AM42-17]
MILEVSKRTKVKAKEIFDLKGIVTVKDIPDLDCDDICFFLTQLFQMNKGETVGSKNMMNRLSQWIHVIYNHDQYTIKDVQSYVKKLKF